MALNIVIENVLRAPDKQQPMSIAITLEWPRYRADAFSLAWRATLLMLVILLLGACSSLPSQGPAPGAAPPSASDGPPGADAIRAIDLDAISDAIPRIEPRSRYGNPPYYEVSGRRYYVRASSDDYVERGIASWYGNKFHGRRTSSGEPYDMYTMTAAHATLPIPTYVEVTNLRNDRKVVVKVNDRGPFHDNRLIDLSYVAALKLGIVAEGTGLVEVRAVSGAAPAVVAESAPAAPAAPPRKTTPEIYLQAGAFADRVNAERMSQRIAAAAPQRTVQVREGGMIAGRALYRVRVGPLSGVEEVDRLTRELSAIGIKEAQVVID